LARKKPESDKNYGEYNYSYIGSNDTPALVGMEVEAWFPDRRIVGGHAYENCDNQMSWPIAQEG
ncbi:MAG: hypothetical protein Q9214_000540, partial [Letrouitia sp. 1 TL-2023]